MRKIYYIIFYFFFILSTSLKAYSSDPKDFVFELVNDAINTLSNKNLSSEEKSKLIENIAIENVDINALGLYTLGELRKSSEKI